MTQSLWRCKGSMEGLGCPGVPMIKAAQCPLHIGYRTSPLLGTPPRSQVRTGGRQGERAASWLTGSPPISPLLKEAADLASGQVLASGSNSRCGVLPTWRSSRTLTVHPLSGKSQNPRVLLGHWEMWHGLISNTETLRDLEISLRQGRNVTALVTAGATRAGT